jgi:colicin import membrane protein
MNSDKTKARFFALAMHALFILLIVFGVSWQKKPQPPVQAELWSNLPPIPQPKVAEPPPPEPAPPPRVAEPPPRVPLVPVPVPVLKPDIALKKVEKEKPKVEPKVEHKVEPKIEPKPAPKKREDDKAARLQKEAEETARREAREQDAQLELAEKEAKAAAAKVAADKAAAERTARAAAAGEAQKYVNGIRSKVWARVALPADLQGNPEAVFEVSLFPGGELANVTMRRSSGNAAYDAAIERAIRQAQPFVVPSGELFQSHFRSVIMAFRPS